MSLLPRRAGRPNTRTVPSLGLMRPSKVLSKVDLPAPFGPSITMNSPSFTVMLMSSKMVRPPRRIRTCSNSTTDTAVTRTPSLFPLLQRCC